jgi:alanine racemase
VRPARLEVDLGAIAHNLRTVKALVGPAVRTIAVVKADGYGHGALPVARRCVEAGADMLAVALVEEGAALRRQGVLAPILVMGTTVARQAPEAVQWGLTCAVMSREQAEALSVAAHEAGTLATVHLKVDTGMSRAGVRADALPEVLPRLAALPNLRWEGIMSHLADATGNPEFTTHQTRTFREAVSEAERHLGPLPYQHLAASAALCCLPEARCTAVRPGNMLYGALEDVPEGVRPDLRPAMSLVAEIASLKPVRAGEAVSYGGTWRAPADTHVALVPVGYADGYPRALSNRAEVLVNGRRCPVVGRVCMDSLLIDVGPKPECAVGDEVVLLGQRGGERITVEELAQRADSITQEIMARMGARLPRVYHREEHRP